MVDGISLADDGVGFGFDEGDLVFDFLVVVILVLIVFLVIFILLQVTLGSRGGSLLMIIFPGFGLFEGRRNDGLVEQRSRQVDDVLYSLALISIDIFI